MASVMLKCIKIGQVLNRRLSFSSVVKHYPRQYLSRSYTNSQFGKKYATAAYKLAANEDSGMKNDDASSNINGKSIDGALAKIDFLIRRNGRTQMKLINKIFSSITSKEVTSSLHGLHLLRGCKYCIDEPPLRRVKMVNDIWNRYQELGIEFDVRHYNAMLDVHVKNNLDFNPIDMLASMEDLKIEPNKDTYMLIMKKYCQDGNISGASEILEYMKEKQMSADEKVFNYLIEGHINNNDMAGAKEMLEVMRSNHLEPTASTHATLAIGYAARGDKEEMMAHLKECKDADNVQNYLKVIEALATSGNNQYIDDVMSLIEHKDLYQPEFINAAVELIHKNCIETAYKLVTSSCTLNYNEGVNIFVKQLIKVNKEISEVLKYCERIQKADINKGIYVPAVRAAAEYQNLNLTVQLFRKLEEMGYHLRPNSFWPIFSAAKEHDPYENCLFALKSMTELGVPCDFSTYLGFVYPVLGVPKPEEVIQLIKQCGQSVETAVDALFVYYCNMGEVNYAFDLTEIVPVKISNKFKVEDFVKLYSAISAESTPKYYKILKYIFIDKTDFTNKSDVQGRLLAELILHKNRLLDVILEKFPDLIFSNYTLYIAEQELNVRNSFKLSFLKKLKALNAERQVMLRQENLSIADEDKYIRHLQDQNLSCRAFLTKRIIHHIREKNITRLQELMSIFDEYKYEYTPLMLSNMFGLWCMASDIDRAKEILNKIKTDFPDFQVELPKALDYVSLLIKYEKFDESYEALKEFLSKSHIYSNRDSLFRSIKRFNSVLSNTQNSEFASKMQNLLLPLSKELGSKKSLLDPSVSIHIKRGDLTSALAEFRMVVTTHHTPACLNQFLKKCIQSNEKDILQQVIDLTISCTSKSYALLELAVAFIASYQAQKAEKVIQNLGLEADSKILDSLCARLSQQNKLNELETLVRITNSLKHVDREDLYCHVFRACAHRNEYRRALEQFEKMKDEGIEPEPETVKLLQDLLKKNNETFPMSLISKSPSEISSLSDEVTKNFLEQLEAGNSEAALKELSSLKKGYIRTLPIKSLTDLVDLCLQNNCTHELSLNVHTMTYIFDNVRDVLKPILEKYSAAGDVEKMKVLLSFMPDFTLMNTGFNSYFCKTFIYSGKYDELLSLLEERITSKNKMFAPVVFEELLKMPQYEERILQLAVKYLDSNYILPMSVLWAYYFSKENYQKADDIHKKYSVYVDRVDNIVLRSIKQNENVDLAKKYLDLIKSTTVRSRIKERAYGAALDLLVFKGMYDEASNLVVDSEKENLQLHKYYLSTLVTLKSALQKENKPVPFTIPLDTRSSEIDSDSD